MMIKDIIALKDIWRRLYEDAHDAQFEAFIIELSAYESQQTYYPLADEWFKDVVVYSLYVDLFNHNFEGLTDKLDYLSDLGVSCLWLLPILDSPMRDAGFDIRDYRKIRPDLLPEGDDGSAFEHFVQKAHEKGIKVIFDIAINHTSIEHPWFREASKSTDNPFRNYYIWSKDSTPYSEARIIFKGIEESNWALSGDEYFFHRFFDFQPDLNYRKPEVLVEMCRNFLFWLTKGVDGFRADAIPYLWKEEGTDCENLREAHLLVKFFRKVLDIVRPNTLLLAEACQKPIEVVKYFGDGDECHAAYHFPLMPQMFKAIAAESNAPIRHTLSTEVTPSIPEGCQWFIFLRCHDELSLELVYVSEEDRKFIHESYCKEPLWNFREGQGISARLAELMDRNPDKIIMAYAVMLSLPGTPVIYYGDEFAKLNDVAYYNEQIKLVGKDDTRFLVRGPVDWNVLEEERKNAASLSTIVFERLSHMLNQRALHPAFGRGELKWFIAFDTEGNVQKEILAFERVYGDDEILCLINLSGKELRFSVNLDIEPSMLTDLLGHKDYLNKETGLWSLKAFDCLWMNLSKTKSE